MELIERLLGHGRWFTGMFLEAALPLSDEQLDREFDIGHRTYRKTEVHLVNVIEGETARLRGVPAAERLPENASIPDTLDAHKIAYDKFEEPLGRLLPPGTNSRTPPTSTTMASRSPTAGPCCTSSRRTCCACPNSGISWCVSAWRTCWRVMCRNGSTLPG
jgi:hypothetical protein